MVNVSQLFLLFILLFKNYSAIDFCLNTCSFDDNELNLQSFSNY